MTTSEKFVKLRSSDDKEFEVPVKIVGMSVTIKNMLEDLGLGDSDESPIPLPNVSGSILEKVIEYCTEHQHDDPQPDDDLAHVDNDEPEGFDAEFVRDMDQGTLFHLILAANFLDIKSLLDLTCKHVASMIKNKGPQEIRDQFNIRNDFTPEEEERVQKENDWTNSGSNP
ncbi:uncharacterized protein MONBRDRAFT_31689 [Monosiga brevicollis MX1]|uniref:Uncharacterized protein n=1 Tax=Monosiga brevicollis TaxID=81824 RepID=A9UV71_MONBE|nr:uncharacterized protein MONBRDRAFT_31689 [Monosiga brevicollis MX1]EDQ90844.1 predicted protein [Monosiga brevicollis MX1]|eukprot:XP_001744141.1 hypothetical protein [Monosiga brevicollis MX1]